MYTNYLKYSIHYFKVDTVNIYRWWCINICRVISWTKTWCRVPKRMLKKTSRSVATREDILLGIVQ